MLEKGSFCLKALILCAGNGVRLGLRKTPKCMVKVAGKPILEHLVDHLNKHGITEIIVNIHKDYEKIFRYFGTRLLYFYEPVLLGEHGTEWALRKWLRDKYVVMNGDTLTNINITEGFRKRGIISFWNFEKNHYAGTIFMKLNHESDALKWNGNGAYYFDCGTPAKLRKARKFYAGK